MFRFENYWIDHLGFMDIVKQHWNNSPFFANAAKHKSLNLNKSDQGSEIGAIIFQTLASLFTITTRFFFS